MPQKPENQPTCAHQAHPPAPLYSPAPPPSGPRFLETEYQEPGGLASLCSEMSAGTESKGLQMHLASGRFD